MHCCVRKWKHLLLSLCPAFYINSLETRQSSAVPLASFIYQFGATDLRIAECLHTHMHTHTHMQIVCIHLSSSCQMCRNIQVIPVFPLAALTLKLEWYKGEYGPWARMTCKVMKWYIFLLCFLKLFIFKGNNCFTMLCWFLPYNNVNQLLVYICPLPLEPPSHLPPHPTPLGCHRAPCWAPCYIATSH